MHVRVTFQDFRKSGFLYQKAHENKRIKGFWAFSKPGIPDISGTLTSMFVRTLLRTWYTFPEEPQFKGIIVWRLDMRLVHECACYYTTTLFGTRNKTRCAGVIMWWLYSEHLPSECAGVIMWWLYWEYLGSRPGKNFYKSLWDAFWSAQLVIERYCWNYKPIFISNFEDFLRLKI